MLCRKILHILVIYFAIFWYNISMSKPQSVIKILNSLILVSSVFIISSCTPSKLDMKAMPGTKTNIIPTNPNNNIPTVQAASLAIVDGSLIDYGTSAINSANTKTLTLTNNGNSIATNIQLLSMDEPFCFKGDVYPGVGGTCKDSLLPGQSCQLTVNFEPSAVGAFSSLMKLNYSGNGSTTVAWTALKGSSLSPAQLALVGATNVDFGNNVVNTQQLKFVSITNLGQTPATFSQTFSVNAPFSIQGGVFPGTGGNCPLILFSGLTCTIAVNFAPTAAGTFSGNLTLNYNNGVDNKSQAFNLVGKSLSEAALVFTNGNSLNFGNVGVGLINTQTLTLKNAGGSPATLIGFNNTLINPFWYKDGSYPGTGGTCGTSLNAGDSCNLVMNYNPLLTGETDQLVNFTYSSGNDSLSTPITLIGVGVLNANLVVSDGPLYDFGSSPVGVSAEKTFTVTNSSTITATSITPDSLSSPFSFKGGSFPGTGGTCGTALAGQATCKIVAVYTPAGTGLATSKLNLNYNNGFTSKSSSVNVQGSGINVGTLTIAQAPSYSFGQVVVGGKNKVTLNLTNSGQTSITGLTASNQNPFSFTGGTYPGTNGTCSTTLDPSNACTVVVEFNPTTVGSFSNFINFNYTASGSSKSVMMELDGQGVTASSLTFLNGQQQDFGNVTVGITNSETLTLTNGGSISATNVSFNTPSSGFTIVSNNCGTSLSPAATCTINVQFSPTSAIAYSDSVSVSYFDGSSNKTISTQLKGVGISVAKLAISDGPTYNFGVVSINQNSNKEFTVTNSGGTSAVSVASAALANGFSFVGGAYPGTNGTCGTQVLAGASCTVEVLFSSTTVGVKTSQLNLSYNDGVASQAAQVAVSADPETKAILAFDSASLNFGSIEVNKSTNKTLTITNNGSLAASVITSADITPFSFTGGTYPGTNGNCGSSIAGGASCLLDVSFSPTASGSFNKNLVFNYNDGIGSGSSTIPFSGVGLTLATLTVSDGPNYDFGTVIIGNTVNKTFTVSNSGQSNTSAVAISTVNPQFSVITGGTCGTTLGAGQNCTVIVSFTPSTFGVSNDNLSVTYNDGSNNQSTSIGIQGSGTSAASLAFSLTSYDFGNIYIGSTQDQVLTVSNSGATTATVLNMSGLGTPWGYVGGAYPGTGGTCGLTLAYSQTCTIKLRFSPTVANTYSMPIQLNYNNGSVASAASTTLTGVSKLHEAVVSFTDGAKYNFGTIIVGQTVSKVLTVSNSGQNVATINSINSLDSPFSFTGGTYPGTGGNCTNLIAGGSTCLISVNYSPTTNGGATSNVVLNYNNGSATMSSSIELDGTGNTPANLSFSQGATYSLGSITKNSNNQFTLNLSNLGWTQASVMMPSGVDGEFNYLGGAYPGTGGTCGTSAAAASNCTIQMKFIPSTTGAVSKTYTISYYNGVANSSVSINITANVNNVTPATLTFSPSNFSYGSQIINTTSSQVFSVVNSGPTTATALNFTGLSAPFNYVGGAFPGTGGTCGASLASSATCTIAIQFSPTATGSFNNTVNLGYNDGTTNSTTSLTLTGSGQSLAVLTVAPGPTFNYNTVYAGASTSQLFTLSNSGTLTATSLGVTGLASPFIYTGGAFPGTGGNCGSTIAGGASCTFAVSYAPTSSGVNSDSLTIGYNNGSVMSSIPLTLNGTGQNAASLVFTQGSNYSVGTVTKNSTSLFTLNLSNQGGSPAVSIAGSGTDSDLTYQGGTYPGTAGTCNSTLSNPGTCSITFKLVASTSGAISKTYTVNYSNGSVNSSVAINITANVIDPAVLTFAPANYNYGTLVTNTSASKTFTVTNSGTATATALAASGLATPFNYTGGTYPGTGGTCSTSLSGSASCTIAIQFLPVATGTFTDTVTLAYNNGVAAASTTENLSGVGSTLAQLVVSPGPTFNYNNVYTGAASSQVFSITNNGTVSATSLAISGLTSPFTFTGGAYPGTGGTCGSTLAGGASCSVSITYSPLTAGANSDSLTIGFNNGSSASSIPLTLNGTGQNPASIVVTQGSTYSIGTVSKTSTNLFTLNLSNQGGVSAVSLVGSGTDSDLTYQGGTYPGTAGTCGSTLNSPGTCSITFKFVASTAGAISKTYTVNYNNGSQASSVAINITANVVDPAVLAFSPASYSYGSQVLNSATNKLFTVTNSGNATATALAVTGLTAPYSYTGGSYPGTGGNCGTTLNAAASCTISIQFSPTASGSFSDTVALGYNNGVSTVSTSEVLSGVGVTLAQLTITPTSPFNYGSVAANSSVNQTFTVANSGASSATSLALTGLAAPFAYVGGSYPGTGGTCSTSLAGSASCLIVIKFAPTASGSFTNTLSLGYNNGAAVTSVAEIISGLSPYPAGSVDTSFGTNGFSQSNILGYNNSLINSLYVQSDGKIIAVGSAINSSSKYQYAIARYSNAGVLDSTFGTSGSQTLSFSNSANNYAYSVDEDSSGNIYTGGYANDGMSPLGELTSTGSLNTANINNGQVELNPNATSTLGRTSIGSGFDSGDHTYINLYKYASTTSGSVTSMSVYVGPVGTAPNNKIQLAIYSDSSGSPGTLIASSSATAAQGNSWNTLPVNASLQSGKSYWLAYSTNGTVDSLNNFSNTNGTGSNAWATQPGFGTFPTTVSVLGTNSSQASLYLNYVPNNGNNVAKSIKYQSGKVLIGGSCADSASSVSFCAYRVNSNATLDSTFGTSGKTYVKFGSSNANYATSMVTQSTGNLVLSGYYYNSSSGFYEIGLARLTPSGVLDTTFGTSGKSTLSNGVNLYPKKSIVLANDKIVSVVLVDYGSSSYTVYLVQFTANGAIDTTFGSGSGYVDLGGWGNTVTADFSLTVQSDGKYLIGGYKANGSVFNYAVARVNTDGSFDNSYGTNGISVVSGVSSTNDSNIDIALTSTGDAVVGGKCTSGSVTQFCLTKLHK
jgi:uncharacterized delta-60 repeat protein